MYPSLSFSPVRGHGGPVVGLGGRLSVASRFMDLFQVSSDGLHVPVVRNEMMGLADLRQDRLASHSAHGFADTSLRFVRSVAELIGSESGQGLCRSPFVEPGEWGVLVQEMKTGFVSADVLLQGAKVVHFSEVREGRGRRPPMVAFGYGLVESAMIYVMATGEPVPQVAPLACFISRPMPDAPIAEPLWREFQTLRKKIPTIGTDRKGSRIQHVDTVIVEKEDAVPQTFLPGEIDLSVFERALRRMRADHNVIVTAMHHHGGVSPDTDFLDTFGQQEPLAQVAVKGGRLYLGIFRRPLHRDEQFESLHALESAFRRQQALPPR